MNSKLRTSIRSAAAAAGAGIGVLALAASVHAAVTPTRDADDVADAAIRSAPPGSVTNSTFPEIPPNGNPVAIGDSNLASFPLNGDDFAILSTGDAGQADAADASNSQGTSNDGLPGQHGPGAYDVVTLRVDLDVPENRNCLSFDFRFLSEEYPEYIGSEYNDGFVAELDKSTFEVAETGVVTAPRNIAQDENGDVVTVNTTGTSNDNALGTTYDGATPILSATTPITPGDHVLFLSVYDSGDAIYDSSVFIDNLRMVNAGVDKCLQGTTPAVEGPERCAGVKATIVAVGGITRGTPGDDVIYGSKGDDDIRAGGGEDLICGRGGDDEIKGGSAFDRILGNAGDDRLRGNGNNDNLRGGSGDDVLHGAKGDDRLRGNGGDNRCKGGSGDDELGVGC